MFDIQCGKSQTTKAFFSYQKTLYTPTIFYIFLISTLNTVLTVLIFGSFQNRSVHKEVTEYQLWHYMKIKFNSDDDIPLNKQLKLPTITVIIRNIFEKDSKYYP